MRYRVSLQWSLPKDPTPGAGFSNLHPEHQLLGRYGFLPTEPPLPMARAEPQPYDLKSKEKDGMTGPQKWPCQPPPLPPPTAGPGSTGAREGASGALELGNPMLREQFPALSFTRSVTLGKDVPSLDLTLPSVTRL